MRIQGLRQCVQEMLFQTITGSVPTSSRLVASGPFFAVRGILGSSLAPRSGVHHTGVSLPLPKFGLVLPLVLRKVTLNVVPDVVVAPPWIPLRFELTLMPCW